MEKMPEGDNIEMTPEREALLEQFEDINAEFDQLQFHLEADKGGGATDDEITEKYKESFDSVVRKYQSLADAAAEKGIMDFYELDPAIAKVATVNEHFFPKK